MGFALSPQSPKGKIGLKEEALASVVHCVKVGGGQVMGALPFVDLEGEGAGGS